MRPGRRLLLISLLFCAAGCAVAGSPGYPQKPADNTGTIKLRQSTDPYERVCFWHIDGRNVDTPFKRAEEIKVKSGRHEIVMSASLPGYYAIGTNLGVNVEAGHTYIIEWRWRRTKSPYIFLRDKMSIDYKILDVNTGAECDIAVKPVR